MTPTPGSQRESPLSATVSLRREPQQTINNKPAVAQHNMISADSAISNTEAETVVLFQMDELTEDERGPIDVDMGGDADKSDGVALATDTYKIQNAFTKNL